MRSSSRLERIPPYLFAQLERKIAEKKAQGIDVISLGIGDPDTPTPQLVVDALGRGRRRPRHAPVPVEPRPAGVPRRRGELLRPPLRRHARPRPRRSSRRSARRSASSTSTSRSSIPGDAALAADPGYPVYTGGPLLVGAEPVLMPLVPERGFAPDLAAIDAGDLERAPLMFINYPNNPTGAVVPDGFFEEVVEFARAHDMLVVHDASYTETTFDGYVAPSFLATPGAKEVGRRGLLAVEGLQHDRLAHGGDRRQRRGRGALLAAQDEHRLGHVRGRAAGRRGRALSRG